MGEPLFSAAQGPPKPAQSALIGKGRERSKEGYDLFLRAVADGQVLQPGIPNPRREEGGCPHDHVMATACQYLTEHQEQFQVPAGPQSEKE